MRALITGAAGFIGSQLAYALYKRNEKIVLLDNFSYGKEDNLIFEDVDFRKSVIKGDIRDKNLVSKIIENGIDYVYHIAGIAPLPDCQSNPQEAIDVNVLGTVNMLEFSRQFGVKAFIFASTNAMYENETEFPTKEDSFLPPTLIYPNTKYAAESFCRSYAITYGMNIACLRFANVYGPHIDCLRKQPPFVGYMIRELFFNRVPTFYSNGSQARDYIYVDDLIDLAVCVRSVVGFDAINVSSNRSISVNEMYKITQEIMEKDIPANFESPEKYWEKYPDLYKGKYRIKSEILEHEVNKYSCCDNQKALECYGWQPQVDIVEGLSNVIQYTCKLLATLTAEEK